MSRYAILDAYILTFPESCSYLRIHIDCEVLIIDDLIVPLLDLAIDPLLEEIANASVDNIGDVSPRQLFNLSLFNRQSLSNLGPSLRMVEHGCCA